ncbi:MAG: cold shock domain-containing protein [Saprospiraceae bacterium]|nr:cold shock domain-containing protein [Saprospiraceae bacterium]
MGKSQESFSKKEREKKRRKKKQEKLERKAQRKLEKAEGGGNQEEFSYVDAYGNITSTPPDPAEKEVIKAEDIIIGIPPKEDEPEEKVKTGRVKFFNYDKGYGFIQDAGSQDSIFVHINNVTGAIQEGDKVSFEVEMGPKGKNAVNVVIL